MLKDSRLQAIILTSHAVEAERFYSEVLQLPLRRYSNGNAVYDVGGSDLTLGRVPSFRPLDHTVMGFAVPDIGAAICKLSVRGVVWAHFEGLPHDARGVVTTQDGDRVAWFRDPDGNILSIVQFSA